MMIIRKLKIFYFPFTEWFASSPFPIISSALQSSLYEQIQCPSNLMTFSFFLITFSFFYHATPEAFSAQNFKSIWIDFRSICFVVS